MRQIPVSEMSFLAVFAALLLAATDISRPPDWGVAHIYIYWVGRILIEAGLIIATVQLLCPLPVLRVSPFRLVAVASLASFIPFVLAVTALDIVLGLPELDQSGNLVPHVQDGSRAKITAFLWELGYLLDNHLFLSFLVCTPVIFGRRTSDAGEFAEMAALGVTQEPKPSEEQEAGADQGSPLPGFLKRLEPPFHGKLLRAEAQEHYVRLVGERESRMVLYRFNDILHELPEEAGMQVHRSHWTAYDAVVRIFRDGTNLKLESSDGAIVPVSRKYAPDAQRAFRDRFDKQPVSK